MGIIITNKRKKWIASTQDKGLVYNTEIVDVTEEGGDLLPDGPMGMVITLPMTVTVTSEYAFLLKLKGELYRLFPDRKGRRV